jgi:hypothetical protein
MYMDKTKEPWLCNDCYETCETCDNSGETCLSCRSDPIRQARDQCKYLGVFSTAELYEKYLSLCAKSQTSMMCQEFLAFYCCTEGTSEYLSCLNSLYFDVQNCRDCTFSDSDLCDKVETLCWKNDRVIQPVEATCVDAILDHCCSHPSECTIFNYSFNCVAETPGVVSAKYRTDNLGFDVEFDLTVNTASFKETDCEQYFEKASFLQLGTSPSCNWTTSTARLLSVLPAARVLGVSLGSQATVIQGPLTLKSKVIKSASGSRYAAIPAFTVELSSNYPIVKARISAPSAISYCSDLRLDASNSEGGYSRGLKYAWSITSSSYDSAFESYVKQWEPSRADASQIMIPFSYLKGDWTVTAKVSVSNAFGVSDAATVDVKVKSVAQPSVTFRAGNSFTLKASATLTITFNVEVPPCMSPASEYNVSWSLVKTTYPGTVNASAFWVPFYSKRIFRYFPGVIESGHSYTFEVAVTPKSSNTIEPGTCLLHLDLIATPPIAVIRGGDRVASVSKAIALSGAESSDPDNPASPLTYLWRCASQYGECLNETTEKTLTIYPNTFKAGLTYTITLTVFKKGFSTSTSCYLSTTSLDVPVLSAERKNTRLNTFQVNEVSAFVELPQPYALSWRQVLGSKLQFTTPLNQAAISIAANSMTPGSSYKLEVTLAHPDWTIVSPLTIEANTPPCCGTFTVSPESGYELKTTYEFRMQDWTDADNDVPLSFTVYLVTTDNAREILGKGNQKSLRMILPRDSSGKTSLKLRVFDTLGAYTDTTTQVTVEDSFENHDDRLAWITTLSTSLDSNIITTESLETSTSELVLLANSAFSVIDGSVEANKKAYQALMKLNDSLDNINIDSKLFTSYFMSSLESITLNPEAMEQSDRSHVLKTINKLTKYFPDPLDDAFMQTSFNLLSNLVKSNNQDSTISASEVVSFDNQTFDVIKVMSAAYLAQVTINQHSANWTSDSFNLQLTVNSPSLVSGVEFKVPATASLNSTAEFKLPSSLLDDLPLNSAVNARMLDSHYKNYKLEGDSESTVRGAHTTSLELELAGYTNFNGQTELLVSPESLNVSNLSSPILVKVPVALVKVGSTTNCTFLNETGGFWTTEGCSFNRSEANAVYCYCNHLTLFSVQEAGEGLVDAGASANVDEATNFDSLTELDFSTKAIGFFVAVVILVVYIIGAVVSLYADRVDNSVLESFKKSRHRKLQMVLSRHKGLLPQLQNIVVKEESPLPEILTKSDMTKDFASDKSSLSPSEFSEQPYSLPTERSSPTTERRLDKDAPDNEDSDLNLMRQSMLRDYGVRNHLINFPINLDKLQVDEHFHFRVYACCVLPERRTNWEVLVMSHRLFRLFFYIDPDYNRIARLTTLVSMILAQLFFAGLFHSTDKGDTSNDKEISISQALDDFSWKEMWVSIICAFLVMPIYWTLKYIFRRRKIKTSMSIQQIERVAQLNKIRQIVGYGLAWAFMVVACIEITIFSIQFDYKANYNWFFTFGFSAMYDYIVANFIEAFFRISAIKGCRCKFFRF